MITVDIQAAKRQLCKRLDLAAAGEQVVIARAGKPLARLVALTERATEPRRLGLGQGRYTLPPDFDDRDAREIAALFMSDDP